MLDLTCRTVGPVRFCDRRAGVVTEQYLLRAAQMLGLLIDRQA